MNIFSVLLFGILLSLSLSLPAQSAKPDATEILQLSKVLPLTPELQALQSQLIQQPQQDTLRLQMAALYLQGARKPGFDDWFHQAHSLLQSLSAKRKASALYGLLQADIQQQQHQFDAALLTLQQVLLQEPDNVNASLMAARIYLAQHQIAAAQQACARLWQDLFLFSACSYEVAGRRGNVAQSYPALQRLYQQQQAIPFALDIWLRGILAEQAELLNQPQQAIAWLVPVLPEAPVSLWLKWADLSLQQGEAQQVYQQLQGLQENVGLSDGLLIRLVLAERATQQGKRYWAQLEPRISLRLARGDTDHAADMVHYFLSVQPDAKAALHWAKLNYASAKEPDDASLLQRAQDAVQHGAVL
jgi:tetratricopeptide (TPR) repeat protein